LAHWEESGDGQTFGSGPVSELAKRTLAYHLASSEQRAQLIQFFELLATNVAARVADFERRRVYGRTLFGVGDTLALDHWVADNRENIAACGRNVLSRKVHTTRGHNASSMDSTLPGGVDKPRD
jgi:hypothetical protein